MIIGLALALSSLWCQCASVCSVLITQSLPVGRAARFEENFAYILNLLFCYFFAGAEIGAGKIKCCDKARAYQRLATALTK